MVATGLWAQVLASVPIAGLEAVLEAMELVVATGALSAEHVLNVLVDSKLVLGQKRRRRPCSLKKHRTTNTGRYDSLRGAFEALVAKARHA